MSDRKFFLSATLPTSSQPGMYIFNPSVLKRIPVSVIKTFIIVDKLGVTEQHSTS
jgi:hypothetical protein